MPILLDTCTFLWAATDVQQLSEGAKEMLTSEDSHLLLSPVSVNEIIRKWQKKRLPIIGDPQEMIRNTLNMLGAQSLPFDMKAAFLLKDLPLHHKDPFDHMLICQALAHDLTILTPDEEIRKYAVKTVW